MKKITIICVLLLIFVLVGCADGDLPEQGSAYEPTKPTFNPETTPAEPRTTEPPGLTPERELQIRENFLLWTNANDALFWLTLDIVYGMHHFGTFDGREVVSIQAYKDFTDNMVYHDVARYTFAFGNGGWEGAHSIDTDLGESMTGGVHLWLHDNGEFMCICVGYERGLLTAEDIGVIWERYNEW